MRSCNKQTVLQNCTDCLWCPPSLLFNGYQGSFLGIKWMEHEVDHSPPPSTKIKNYWNYTSTPPICLLGMDRNSFTFTLLSAYQTSQMNFVPGLMFSFQPATLTTFIITHYITWWSLSISKYGAVEATYRRVNYGSCNCVKYFIIISFGVKDMIWKCNKA